MECRHHPLLANARRMPYLKLVANTFEEERILCGLFELMVRGGTITISVKESGEFLARDLTCDFGEVSNASA